MQLGQLNEAFRKLGIVGDATENHGLLCGLLCARGQIAENEWVSLMTDDAPLPQEGGSTGGVVLRPARPGAHAGMAPHSREWSAISALYDETVREMQDPDQLFSLLLPSDEEALDIRAEAVSAWCRGYIYGLGAGGIDDLELLPEDVREVVGDVIEISHASSETDHGEEDESAFSELVEYLRAGVTLVFETLEAERRTAAGERTVH